MLCNMSLSTGPLLTELLDAQAADASAMRYPEISQWAESVVEACAALGDAVLWPVGSAAERLVGAAVLASRGHVRAWTGSELLAGETVALLALHLVGPIPVFEAARAARALGAERVVACVASVPHLDGVDVDGIVTLSRRTELRMVAHH